MRRPRWLAAAALAAALAGAAADLGFGRGSGTARRLVEIPPGHVLSGEPDETFDAKVGEVQAVTYSEEEDLLFVGGASGAVTLWRGGGGLFASGAAGAAVSALAYVGAGNRLVAVGREDGILRFLQVQDRAILGEVQENAARRVITAVEFLEYDDDVESYVQVATSSADNTIKIWDVRTRSLQRTLEGHTRPVLKLRFFKTLELLASGGWDGLLGLWNLPRATRVATGKQCVGATEFLDMAYRPGDCLRAAIEAGGTYFIHGFLQGTAPNSCELQPDVCDELQDSDYTLYRVEAAMLHLIPAHAGGILALEVVDGLGLVISAGEDGLVKFWEPATANLVRTIDTGSTNIRALLFVEEVRALLVSTDVAGIYYDTTTGQLLKSVPAMRAVAGLALQTAHGSVAVSVGEDVAVYPVLAVCTDGRYPRNVSTCELCPENKIGTGGFCPTVCDSGMTSDAGRTACVPCAAGKAGSGGFCEPCQPGHFQNEEGQVACKRCQKGSAQRGTGFTFCWPCLDNTVAETAGQAECLPCPDGQEPAAGYALCVPCGKGSAGTQGVCFQCKDGEQPREPLPDQCTPCPPGTAGLAGSCELCPDGTQPQAERTSCQPCPEGFAGTKGLCARCQPGQMPAEGSSFCMFCPPGEFGTNGTCSPCAAGWIPNDERTACLECPNGQPSARGVCTPCTDGETPNEGRTQCLPCPEGAAGRGGLCDVCPWGFNPNEDLSECVACPETAASSVGVCFECDNGTQPDTNRSGCEPCPAGSAGMLGRCLPCDDGQQQDASRTFCEQCPPGFAGTGGLCDPCEHPYMQDETFTKCTLQVFPTYYAFASPHCKDQEACSSHFAHVLNADEGQGSLFCCPTLDGELLACCSFETPAEAAQWAGLAGGLDAGARVLEEQFFIIPLFNLAALALVVWRFRKMKTSDALEDWRESLVISPVAWAVFPVAVFVFMLIFPWICITVFVTAWVPLLSMFVFKKLYFRFGRMCYYSHNKRQQAVASMRVWLWSTFALTASITCFEKLHDWVIIRFLLADLSGAIFYFCGVRPVQLVPFEAVVENLPFPWFLRTTLVYIIRVMRTPEVLLSNTVVHIDVHAANFASTLLATTGLVVGQALAVYVLLVLNLSGRMEAAKQSVLLSRSRPWRRARRLAFLGLADLTVTFVTHWAAIWPSRMLPLLVQLAPLRQLPDSIFGLYATATLGLYVVVLQLFIIFLWAVVASGRHVENPPSWMASFIETWTGVQFDEVRREQYLTATVLKALSLWGDSDSDDDGSSRGSPRSGRSGGSRSGRSPGRRSGRSGGRSGRSGRSRSPRSGRSSRSGGSSPRSPRSYRGSDEVAKAVKVPKNLGSAKQMLMRYAGVKGSPRSKSPRGGNSPRAGLSPRGAGGTNRRMLRFVRMPDGSRSRLSPRARQGELSPRPDGVGSGRNPQKQGAVPAAAQGGDEEHPEPDDRAPAAPAERRGSLVGRLSRLSLTGVDLGLLGASDADAELAGRGQRRGSVAFNHGLVADSPLLNSKERARHALSLENFIEDDMDNMLDVTALRMTPQQLYNRLPHPPYRLTLAHFCAVFRDAVRCSWWTSLGWWKEPWNSGPHQLRKRARDLTAEACRNTYDRHDYYSTQRAIAKNIGGAMLLLPCGVVFSVLAHLFNHPPLRICDHSVDIMRHKIEEFTRRGTQFKEAEATLRRSVVSTTVDRNRELWEHRLETVLKFLNIIVAICVLLLSLWVGGEASLAVTPPLFLGAAAAVLLHCFVSVVLLPLVRLQNLILISCDQDLPGERVLLEQVKEALGSDESSVTEDSSSAYSSANESFLDEDPESEALPSVLGAKRSKVLVRPRACRLRLHFQLLRGSKPCGGYSERFYREDPHKHGHLLRVPGFHDDAMPRSRTVSFWPTEESDGATKTLRHRLRRSHSTGACLADESFEHRAMQDRWAAATDVFQERQRGLVPPLPETERAVPRRGAIDRFEAAGVFRPRVEGEATNQALFWSNPLGGTVAGDRLWSVAHACSSKAAPAKPWERTFDEALQPGGLAGSMALGSHTLEALEESRHARSRQDGIHDATGLDLEDDGASSEGSGSSGGSAEGEASGSSSGS